VQFKEPVVDIFAACHIILSLIAFLPAFVKKEIVLDPPAHV
jgi:hypothetical protein